MAKRRNEEAGRGKGTNQETVKWPGEVKVKEKGGDEP